MSLNSGGTAKSTSGDGAINLITEGARPSATARKYSIRNDGAVPGFYSIDGGATYHRLPPSRITEINYDRPVPYMGVMVKRIAGGSNLSGLYATVGGSLSKYWDYEDRFFYGDGLITSVSTDWTAGSAGTLNLNMSGKVLRFPHTQYDPVTIKNTAAISSWDGVGPFTLEVSFRSPNPSDGDYGVAFWLGDETNYPDKLLSLEVRNIGGNAVLDGVVYQTNPAVSDQWNTGINSEAYIGNQPLVDAGSPRHLVRWVYDGATVQTWMNGALNRTTSVPSLTGNKVALYMNGAPQPIPPNAPYEMFLVYAVRFLASALYPIGSVNYSSGTTAKATTTAASVMLVSAPSDGSTIRSALITNDGSVAGFYSLDAGTTWDVLRASDTTTITLATPITNQGILIKRDVSNLSGVYGTLVRAVPAWSPESEQRDIR